MANFPSLVPASRSYNFGQYPVTVETGFAGGNVRFLHGSNQFNIELGLRFNALTQANAKLIREHYRGQNAGYLSFQLPATIWSGFSSASAFVPTATLWKYAAFPEEEHLQSGPINVTVQLVSVI
jgi:hypothetical protein